MGNKCISCHHRQQKKLYHTQLPSDVDKYRSQNLNYTLPKIMFQAQIYNIQMINCPSGVYSMNFEIIDVISIMLPQKQIINKKNKSQININQLQWKLHERFGFAMNQFQLRTHFLNIQIFGQNKTKINQIAVNLYLITTGLFFFYLGPQHHDLQVMIGKNKFCRLKFDCKISQVVQVNLLIDQIKIQFNQDWQGEQFDYSFKIIVILSYYYRYQISLFQQRNNQVIAISQSTDPKIIKSPQDKNIYRQPTLDDQCKSPLKFRKTISSGNKMIKRDLKSYVQWGQGDHKDTSLMSINAKLLSNDINKSYFYFLVWKFANIQGAKQASKDDWNLFAGVLINFNKLFQKPYQQRKLLVSSSTQTSSRDSQKIGFDVQQRLITIQQPLWGQDGNSSIGKCLIKMSMKNPKFEKQQQACARTQDGIVNMTFLFKSYVGKNTRIQNGKTSKIIQKYQQIETILKKLTTIPNDSYSHRSQILLLQQEVYENFKQIAQTIRSTLPQSLIILSISNPQQINQMIQDQLLLIDLMNKLYYNINDNTVYAGICWEIVLLIMKRGEFYLQNIGFMGIDKSNKQIYQKKYNCAVKYQSILYKYFLIALRTQNSSQVRNPMTTNIQAFKAYSYVKIPLFRQKIIDSIQKAYDQDIVDFRLQQLDTYTGDISAVLKNKNRSIINLNWDKYFHDQIRNNPQNTTLQKQVQDEIQNSKWIQQISKRQEQFFNFVAQLVKRLNELTQRIKTWKWNYFPGYTKIIRGFMVQMKKRKLMDYPQLMIKTSIQLLVNQQLVNILMPIIIQKTNSYNKIQVIKCLSIIQSFFNCLTEHQTKELPRIFNYLYFFKTFKLIIQTIQHNEAIIKALILIYDFYQWLSPQWKDNITMYLLGNSLNNKIGKVFFKLFFHWSFQIRIIFYNFLIIKVKYIRIQQISKLPSNSQSILMNTRISDRYQQITTILTNAQNMKKQQVLDYRIVYEKQLFKKMKNKMRKKKQKQSKQTSSKYSYRDDSSKKDKNYKKPGINCIMLDNYGLKQNQYKRTNKYRLDNLLQNKNSRRLSIGDQDMIRNRSSTQFIGQRVNNKQDQDQEKLQITRGSSFYMDMNSIQNTRKLSTDVKLYGNEKDQLSQTSIQDILDRRVHNKAITNQRPNGQRIGRLQLKPLGSKINYNIYNREDHQLSQISYTQINYLSKAIEEYKDTLNQINRYYQKRGQLPKRQLQMEPMLSDQV